MRVCPKCGYEDEPYWRATFNRKMDEDYTHIDNFGIMFPKEIEQLKKEKVIHIPPFIFRLTKHNYVIRRWEKLKDYSPRDYERHRPKNPNQKLLREMEK